MSRFDIFFVKYFEKISNFFTYSNFQHIEDQKTASGKKSEKIELLILFFLNAFETEF